VVPLDYADSVAADWPDLLEIVERKVKPERLAQNREIRARYWWRFGEVAPALHEAVSGLQSVLVNCQVAPHLAFARVRPGSVFAHSLNVFASAGPDCFAFLQCRVHESWARFLASSMKDDIRYTPSDCFETFPFPSDWEHSETLEVAGSEYYEFRAALMVRNDQGLTKTYNRFHDPDERHRDILRLRELHDAMDRAVLDAYGWTDIQAKCEFILDYDDDEEDTPGKASRRRKPWRYRWPDAIRDEVLARLLALNAERAEAEALADVSPRGTEPGPKKQRQRKKTPTMRSGEQPLPGMGNSG
jgi:hypothetical protein